MKRTGILLIPLLLAVALAWAEEEWILKKEKDGIRSYTRAVEGWEVHQCRGVGYVNLPFERTVKARLDFDRFFSNNTNMESYRILDDRGPNNKIVYAVIDVPWPAKDRDVVFEVKVTRQKDRVVTTSRGLANYSGAPPGDGYIRMAKMREKHIFIRKGERTLVITESLADPGGKIPPDVINWMLANAPIKTIKTIREIAKNYKPNGE
jgi:hypothetical protein